MTLRRVAVFCGSSPGNDERLVDAAYDVGRALAQRGLGLVYGGGGAGLMGAVSQGALDHDGEVIGVIPQSMVDREWARHDIDRLEVVTSMHERKARMSEVADAFLCLPGGLGTLEEIFEVWSWRQLGYLDDPVGFLDVDGFWQPFLDGMQGLVDAGFVRQPVLDDLVVARTLDEALAGFEARLRSGVGRSAPRPLRERDGR